MKQILTVEQWKAINGQKRIKAKQLARKIKEKKGKNNYPPDPREKSYPEDLEGLTEGERKL